MRRVTKERRTLQDILQIDANQRNGPTICRSSSRVGSPAALNSADSEVVCPPDLIVTRAYSKLSVSREGVNQSHSRSHE
ncbi:unnamed protein product [Lasius platythorax]|uniref:Uncharacterized protein n=1 Tax=Lasius platythorax TaxID=488582 RepID=A0AAV2MZ23_9HYME